jgi:hypothetical protein
MLFRPSFIRASSHLAGASSSSPNGITDGSLVLLVLVLVLVLALLVLVLVLLVLVLALVVALLVLVLVLLVLVLLLRVQSCGVCSGWWCGLVSVEFGLCCFVQFVSICSIRQPRPDSRYMDYISPVDTLLSITC